jgi:hypothetical protein
VALAYLRISLSLTMRLISATSASLTHTVHVSWVMMLAHETYSLCGSGSHCGSWSCSHIVLMRCAHLPTLENRTLKKCQHSEDRYLTNQPTQELVTEAALVTRAARY